MDREQRLNRTPSRRRHPEGRRVVVVRLRPRDGGRRGLSLSGTRPEEDAAQFAELMRRKSPPLTPAEKHQLLTTLRKDLPPAPRPGRPPRADVTEALRLADDGVPRKEIYRR